MENAQYRHDISDEVWRLLEPLLPGQKGQWGRVAKDNRTFVNGVFWEMRTGAPWRDLSPEYGKWNTVYQLTLLSRLGMFYTYQYYHAERMMFLFMLKGRYFFMTTLVNADNTWGLFAVTGISFTGPLYLETSLERM